MRPIDADALMNELRSMVKYENDGAVDCGSYNAAIIDAKAAISSAPTLSPDEVRGVGEWEDAKQHGLCRCSVCKDCYIEKDYITQAKWNYCPNCGARLEVREDA